jgi:hypothetical protein
LTNLLNCPSLVFLVYSKCLLSTLGVKASCHLNSYNSGGGQSPSSSLATVYDMPLNGMIVVKKGQLTGSSLLLRLSSFPLRYRDKNKKVLLPPLIPKLLQERHAFPIWVLVLALYRNTSGEAQRHGVATVDTWAGFGPPCCTEVQQ